uniref:Myozenin 3a n=1 Tax=Lepisosteus oculatus TaxID=7918 RepID=W5MYL0_LEPOC
SVQYHTIYMNNTGGGFQNSTYSSLAKERRDMAIALSKEVEGEHLNLGKKISVPQDVQMEELALLSNKGSRMFHERQKRVQRFTLENTGESRITVSPPDQHERCRTGAKHRRWSPKKQPGKGHFLSALKNTAATKPGSPSVIAPGYAGPLKEIPHEKFNITVIPKSYHSPWQKARGENDLLVNLNVQLPEVPQMPGPSTFRCFNRVAMPFGGTAGSERIFPLPGFELSQAQTEPNLNWERINNRPNFNRAPRGWGVNYSPESSEL